MQAEGHITEGGVDRRVHARFFSGQTDGVMVEVGAARPDYLSLSALYRSLGWAVLSIEPNPDFCELHRAQGHQVLQYACGDRDEDGVEFSIVDSHGAAYEGGTVSFESFSALAIKPEYAQTMPEGVAVRKITVDLRRLDTLLAEHAPTVSRIDLLTVDVEGWELEVLNGLTFDRYRPRVLIIENLLNEKDYRRHMARLGYGLWRRIAPTMCTCRRARSVSRIGRWRCCSGVVPTSPLCR
jgi:FkbM family methyltransferase